MKTVTEIRRSSSRDTFIAESLSCTEFFVGLGASGEIETEVVCFTVVVFSVRGEQHNCVCDEGFGQRKQAG